MPAHRVTYYFEASIDGTQTAGAGAGWSETWYTSVNADEQQCLNAALVLMQKRRMLLTAGWSITGIRISRLGSANQLLRKGTLTFVAFPNGKGTYPGLLQDEQPYDSLVWAMSSTAGYRRAFMMRGIGQDVINAGGRFVNPAAFGPAAGQWLAEITNSTFDVDNAWSIRFRTKITDAANPVGTYVVTRVDIAPVGGVFASPQAPIISIDRGVAGPVIPPGATVVLADLDGLQSINGAWSVLGDVPTDFTKYRLAPKRRVSVSGAFQGSGIARFFTYSLDSFNLATPGHGASRRTGRPLRLVRGRRSNRSS